MACYTLQVTDPDALPWATREVPLRELVSTYLRAIAPSAYCDPCLAAAVRELVLTSPRPSKAQACPVLFV